MFQAPRGTYDLLPLKAEGLRAFLNKAIAVLEKAGFVELETPILEEARLFNRSVGEGSDIVTKEMYTFRDKKGRLLALRPEGTAPIVRAYLEHHLFYSNPSARFYYYGPMFRYDRPQKGRYRQFLQLGVEVFASAYPHTDAEVIFLLYEILSQGGIEKFKVKLNNLGCRKCQKGYEKRLSGFLEGQKKKLCGDCQIRLKKNPLRTFDCKVEDCQEVLSGAPTISNFLCRDCQNHFQEVLDLLEILNVKYQREERLVRGLDYYTRTVWEATAGDRKDAIAAGGRYDNLVADLGGPEIPALGFAIGLERVLELLPLPQPQERRGVRFIYLGAAARKKMLALLCSLRRLVSVPVTISPEEKSLKSQLRLADKDRCLLAIIAGTNELERGVFTIRNLANGHQQEVKEAELIERITKCCGQ